MMVFAVGDLLRLEVSVKAGSNDLTVLRNGAIVGTFSDNSGGRPLVGVPGIAYIFQGSNAFFATLHDFKGGPL